MNLAGTCLLRLVEVPENEKAKRDLFEQACLCYGEAVWQLPGGWLIQNNRGLGIFELAGLEENLDIKARLLKKASAKFAESADLTPDAWEPRLNLGAVWMSSPLWR